MKKTILAVVLATAVGVIGVQQASAKVLGPHHDRVPQFQQMDEATRAKLDKFRADTQDLRKQMVMKRAEEAALIHRESPDMDAVRKVAEEMFDLRTAMFEKAKTAGLFVHPKQGADAAKIAEERAKYDKFYADTQDLRKQMSVKRVEERALLQSRNANPEAVAKVAGELFDLRSSLRDKAKAAGLPATPFHRMGGEHMGPDRHFLHKGGFGMMDGHEPMGLGLISADEPGDEGEVN